MKKKILIIVITMIVLLVSISSVFIYKSAEKASIQAREIQINNIDLLNIEDGTYKGEYSFNNLVKAEVQVSVKNHAISDIKLIQHNHGKGKEAEKLPNQVINAQSLEIDVIAGATVSSKVILKAIENALAVK